MWTKTSCSVYNLPMNPSPLPLCALAWTPDLATALADASAAVARLNARILASSWAPAWRLRVSWAGYASALRLQAFAVDSFPAAMCLFRLSDTSLQPRHVSTSASSCRSSSGVQSMRSSVVDRLWAWSAVEWSQLRHGSGRG